MLSISVYLSHHSDNKNKNDMVGICRGITSLHGVLYHWLVLCDVGIVILVFFFFSLEIKSEKKKQKTNYSLFFN